MSSFNENRQLFNKIIKGRQPVPVREIEATTIWIEDIKEDKEVVVSFEEKEDWLQVKNETGEKPFGLILIDGVNGVFKRSSPTVIDESMFEFIETYQDTTSGEQKSRIKKAGPCDCLILDTKWRFIEFKTKKDADHIPTTKALQEDQNRRKAALQLARTLTFFREQAMLKKVVFPSVPECVLVTRADSPPPIPFNPFSSDAISINDPTRFFILFKARFVEVKTNETYSLT